MSKKIEEAARDFSLQMRGEDKSDVSDSVNLELMKQAFRAGHDHAIEMASYGFNEYFKSLPEDTHDISLKECWRAAKLTAQKELKEKDARIKLLEKYLVILDRNSRSNYISKQEGELVKLIRIEIKQIGEMK